MVGVAASLRSFDDIEMRLCQHSVEVGDVDGLRQRCIIQLPLLAFAAPEQSSYEQYGWISSLKN